jgi:pimeloyl-ACP methyl ester carboxylesterase
VRLHLVRSTGGTGVPVLLVHGFSRDHSMWAATGWTQALERTGRRWLAPDLLGHGASPRPHEREAYQLDAQTRLLAEALEEEPADVVGYSLGGELALEFALAYPERVRRLVIGGIGDHRPNTGEAAAALYESVVAGTAPGSGPTAAMWARATSVPGADRVALAACLAGVSGSRPLHGLERFPGPTLLFAGTEDPVADGVERLRDSLPEAELVRIRGHDHFTTLATAEARSRTLDFLSG